MNGKVYPFKFGVGFLKRANARYKEIAGGSMTAVENGFIYLLARAEDGHVDAIAEMLLMANKGLKPQVTMQTIEDYIDDECDIDALWLEMLDFLKSSAACKKLTQETLNKIHPKMEESQAA